MLEKLDNFVSHPNFENTRNIIEGQRQAEENESRIRGTENWTKKVAINLKPLLLGLAVSAGSLVAVGCGEGKIEESNEGPKKETARISIENSQSYTWEEEKKAFNHVLDIISGGEEMSDGRRTFGSLGRR